MDQVDAIENRLEKKHKIVRKKGLIGLKNLLMTEKIRKKNLSKKSAIKEVKGLKGLTEYWKMFQLWTKLRVMKYKIMTP